MSPPVIALVPEPDAGLAAAVEAGGGRVGLLEEAEGAIVHRFGAADGAGPGVPPLPENVRWIQLPAAGVETWLRSVPEGPLVTSATGAFALPVAEHAFALLLTAARSLHTCARAEEWIELDPPARSLEGATIAIVGAGGIGRALIELLRPLHPRILAVTRRGRPVEGAERTVAADQIDEILPEAEYVVLAAPATDGSRRLMDADRLALLRPDAWVVNVGRGSLVDTEALVDALDAGTLGGAALDVTDPEPLPPDHPLWLHPRAMITPHIATTEGGERRHYEQRVRENVARFVAGDELLGVVDRDAGY